MTEEKKGVRELERELAKARAEQYAHHSRSVTKNRDFSVGGVDQPLFVDADHLSVDVDHLSVGVDRLSVDFDF